MPDLFSRFIHAWAILKRPFISCVAALFGLLSAFALVRDEFFPAAWRDALKTLNLIKPILSIQWYWFAILMLIALLLSAIEGSFRLFTEKLSPVRVRKAIVSNVRLLTTSSNTEHIYLIFNVLKRFNELSVTIRYSAFINGTQWTYPATVVVYNSKNVARGQRIDLKLITREDSKDYLTGIHWGPPTRHGEPYNHVFTAGLFRARIIFEGDTKKEVQHYYFFCDGMQDER